MNSAQNAPQHTQSARGSHIQIKVPSQDPMPADGEIDPGNAPGDGFAPLRDCPAGKRDRYAATAAKAHEPFKAVKLKCLDCSGWDYPEAKQCTIRHCALWKLNKRVFKGGPS